MANSAVASRTYTLRAATPTFDPPGGTYLAGPVLVSISSASPEVTIYYTTDGTTPTTSSTQYGGPILVVLGTTVQAIAVRAGWSQSAVASATYQNLLGL
jgi:chitobiase/beta-hexosaminidase-like protein